MFAGDQVSLCATLLYTTLQGFRDPHQRRLPYMGPHGARSVYGQVTRAWSGRCYPIEPSSKPSINTPRTILHMEIAREHCETEGTRPHHCIACGEQLLQHYEDEAVSAQFARNDVCCLSSRQG